MDNVPLEVIVRHASHKVGDFFAEKVFENRKHGKVAVLVEDFTNSLYFMPCDKHGYPNVHEFKYMTFDSYSLQVLNDGEIPSNTTGAFTSGVEETAIYIERPMLSQRYDWQDKPYVFLWYGRKMSSRKIPLEKLNVSELLKIAQQVVKNREGLVVDEAIANKIYK